MGVSKVVYGNDTLIDISEDTVAANNLLDGETAHGSNGELVRGTAVIPPAVAVKGDNEQNYRTGNVNLTSENIGSLWTSMGSSVGSLDALVNLMNNSGNQRSYAGTIKITTNIGVGVTGWTRIFATAQNAPNNGNYDLGMFCLFFPADSSNIKYALINGKTTGNYSVASTGSIPYTSDLATVATSGSYSDLSNKPTIPAAVAVKGNSETNYRTGNVNLTSANIGALALSGGSLSGNLTITRANSGTSNVDSRLVLGNSTPSGTTGASRGYITMYGTNAYGANLLPPSDNTAVRNYTLPSASGNVTLAHTGSNITGSAASLKNGSLDYCYYANNAAILQGSLGGACWLTNTGSAWKTVFQTDGNLVVYQNSTAKWSSGTSSRRFKHNIQDMTEERARKILDIRPVTFDWNDDQPITTRPDDNAGVIAEEVSQVCPDLVVFEDLEDGSQTERRVEYERFTPYLIKMVQMQQQEIDILKEEVRLLKERL